MRTAFLKSVVAPWLLPCLTGLCWAADPNAPVRVEDYKAPIRVACVGDSITAGAGIKDRAQAYPAQLGRMLGDGWEVRNFGVGGATLLKSGDKPYWKQAAFKNALDFKPDVVVLKLGTNDTKPQNWKHKDQLAADYKEMIEQFEKLPSKPRVFVCHPAPVPGKGNFGINEAGVEAEIPIIDEVAREEHAGVIDIYGALKEHAELLPDRVHPNAQGATIVAKTVYEKLTGKGFEGAVPAKTAKPEALKEK